MAQNSVSIELSIQLSLFGHLLQFLGPSFEQGSLSLDIILSIMKLLRITNYKVALEHGLHRVEFEIKVEFQLTGLSAG